jgi:hypothetical protein
MAVRGKPEPVTTPLSFLKLLDGFALGVGTQATRRVQGDYWIGAKLIANLTTFAGGATYTVSLRTYLGTQAITLLTSAPIGATGSVQLIVDPRVIAEANRAAQDTPGRIWDVLVTNTAGAGSAVVDLAALLLPA